MSLTAEDLHQIRTIVREEVDNVVEPLRDGIEALGNDTKEIYNMISRLQKDIKEIQQAIVELQSTLPTDSQFQKLDLEQKMLRLHAELMAAAKQAGITLPQ